MLCDKVQCDMGQSDPEIDRDMRRPDKTQGTDTVIE